MLYQKGNNDLAKVKIKFTPNNTNGYTLATLYAEVYELYGALVGYILARHQYYSRSLATVQ